ncbi:MAG: Rv1355c family protein [Corynebacteriales bacterium]|nr:Rv1355c family protein [Mycobacteriales bacterium]
MSDHSSTSSSRPTSDLASVEILDPSDDRDRLRIAALRDDSAVQVTDTLAAQRISLSEVVPAPDDHHLRDSRWVFYPWRSTLVHLLGPSGFRRLRLDRNQNKITLAEDAVLRSRRVGVVGLSVGHCVAHTIAIEGLAGTLRLADFDEIDLSNLNRVPATVFDIGVNKAVVAARRIAEIDPYLTVEIMPVGIDETTAAHFLDGLDLVAEECDSFDAKVLIRDRARAAGIPVIMETSDGGVLDVERFDLSPDRPLFHGLLGDIDAAGLTGLTAGEKVPLALTLLDPTRVTSRMAASALEVGATLATWPQLGGDVALGGASCAAAVRRLGLGLPLPSGRVRIDIEAALDRVHDPLDDLPTTPPLTPPTPETPDLAAIFDRLPDDEAVAFAASRAPSAHNGQPWSIGIDGDGIDARIRETAPPRITDLARRMSAVALGALAHNMEVAASARGRLGRTTIHDDGMRVRHEMGTGADDRAHDIGLVLRRATSRLPGDGSPLHPAEIEALTAADARVHLLTDRAQLETCSALLGDGARIRHLTPALHAEMTEARRRPGSADPDTGVDIESLGVPVAARGMLDLVSRPDAMAHLEAWGAGSVLGAPTAAAARSSSALVAISVDDWGRESFVRGGMATEAVWLCATALGLAVSPAVPPSLYAANDDERRQISLAHARALGVIDRGVRQSFGLDDNAAVAVILRVFRNPTPVPVSRRRPPLA